MNIHCIPYITNSQAIQKALDFWAIVVQASHCSKPNNCLELATKTSNQDTLSSDHSSDRLWSFSLHLYRGLVSVSGFVVGNVAKLQALIRVLQFLPASKHSTKALYSHHADV
jgi:hypothetical protein